tara:strand:+ start:47 stop:358 length:312 start_codon:yes stop_codon:yes gene_type:complete
MVEIRKVKLTEEQLALVALVTNDETLVRPQRDEVDAIINNIKIHTSLEQLGHVEDTKLRLIGIEKSIYDAIDCAFNHGLDIGKAMAEDDAQWDRLQDNANAPS